MTVPLKYSCPSTNYIGNNGRPASNRVPYVPLLAPYFVRWMVGRLCFSFSSVLEKVSWPVVLEKDAAGIKIHARRRFRPKLGRLNPQRHLGSRNHASHPYGVTPALLAQMRRLPSPGAVGRSLINSRVRAYDRKKVLITAGNEVTPHAGNLEPFFRGVLARKPCHQLDCLCGQVEAGACRSALLFS
ncbi:hypothetical protein V1278_004499 [Bradyrhizobium sp. AZCC 1577]